MQRFDIDINADLGEGLGNEHLLIPLLSSCNIACGGHAGDVATITSVIKMCLTHNVKIGAHPSFPDKDNFGRVVIDINNKDLEASLIEQITLFQKIAKQQGANVHHVKAHGALYNLLVYDIETSKILVEVVKSINSDLAIYAPYKSVLSEVAIQNGMKVIFEAFVDRNYQADLSLLSRQKANALLINPKEVLQHLLRLVLFNKVKTVEGQEVDIKASTYCIHGDTKNACEMLEFLHVNLPSYGIHII